MDVYNQFLNPTTSLFSLYCHFTGENDDNLIVSKGNLLQIFKIIDVNNIESTEKSIKLNDIQNNKINSENGNTMLGTLTNEDLAVAEKINMPEYEIEKDPLYKLILVSEYSLNGKIIDVHTFRPSNLNDIYGETDNLNNKRAKVPCKVDFLIVSTEFAKLSIVKWNPSDNLVSVVSLHYYESLLDSLSMEKLKTSDVIHRTDPNFGCTLLHVNDLLVFLPFKKNTDEDDDDYADDNDDYNPLSNLKDTPQIVLSDSKISNDFFLESFIINSKTLHPNLKNIVDIQFLNSYRNPTVAILYAPDTLSWTGFLPQVKDNMTVIVLSLDLEKKTADVIIEINNLPYDVERIVPLDKPINGFLLMGSNEIIHVNSLGSPKGMYVNEFFTKTSSFNLKDNSDLNLLLELSDISQISDDEALLITKGGVFYTLIFDEIGGVSSLSKITKNPESSYSDIKICDVLHIRNIPQKNMIFVCSQSGDAMLLNWDFQSKSKSDTSSKADIANDIFDEDEDFWLYEGSNNENDEASSSLINSKFIISDKLINIGPLSDITLGYSSLDIKLHGLPNPNFKEKVIYGSSGLEETACISEIIPSVKPSIKSSLKFSNATKIWTIADHKNETKYLITTDHKKSKTEIFDVQNDYKTIRSKNFINKSFTIQFGVITEGEKVRPVQVVSYKIMVFNMAFNHLTAMSFDKEINHCIIQENHIVLLMKNGEIEILEYDCKTETLNKMDLPALLNYQIFTNAWVSKSSLLNHATPIKKRTLDGDVTKVVQNSEEQILFWLVTADNRLLVFKKNHLEKVFEFKNIHKMSEYLQLSSMDPNYEADVDPILKQCIYTKIGDEYDAKNYLILLTFGGEIIIYESFFDPTQQCFKLIKSNDLFQLPISGAPGNSYSYATKIERNLFKIKNLDGKQVVMVTGAMPFIIYKQYNSVPRMFKFTSKPLLYFAPFTNSACTNGLITIDDKISCRMVQLDLTYDYSNKLPISKHCIGETINKISYHEATNTFVISTLKKEKYQLLDAEGEDTIEYNKELKNPALNYRGSIKLISPEHWKPIDTMELEVNEVCTTLNVMNLKNNGTDSERVIIFVGTGVYQNEDVPTFGTWKLLDLISVVPEPGHPEAKYKMKSLTSETSKGPILDACSVDGRFSLVQGQRLMVRMIKNEGNAIPVAFTDTSLYSVNVKSFENLMVIGDSYHGVSLYGFDAEPYRMISLGKDEHEMKLRECDFIVHNQNLYILAADDNGILHMLQYDPYDTSSLKGHKLIRKSAFRSNSHTTRMLNVSRRASFFSMVSTLPIRSDVDLGFEVIGSNIDGSLFKVSPINEYQYRRLYSLQNYIADKEHHWLGLNPRMNATGNLEDELSVIKRPFIEYKLLSKFTSMNEDKKKLFAMRLGKDALVDIYRDMISLQ